MRCRACDRILTYTECVLKSEDNGDYLDTCLLCLDELESGLIDAELDSDKELLEELARPLREDEIELDGDIQEYHS